MKNLKQKIVEILEEAPTNFTDKIAEKVKKKEIHVVILKNPEKVADQILKVVKEEYVIQERYLISTEQQEVLDEVREFRFYVSDKMEQNANNCYELLEKVKSWQEKLKGFIS